jgi:transposase
MRPGQRFVALRSIDNQAAVTRHRVREQLVGQRTALLNALRGHLSEIGLVAAQGAQHAYRLKRMLAAGADENGEIVVPERVRVALAPLAAQIDALDQVIAAIDDKLIETVKADEKARRLMTIPGVGPVIATAVVATVVLCERTRVRRLSRPRAASAFERWQGAPRAHHENGGPISAQASCGGRDHGAASRDRPQ